MKFKIWMLIIPVLVLVSFNVFLPSAVVFNYSFQTPFANVNRFVGFEHFKSLLGDVEWWNAVGRSFVFSFTCLAIQIPLGLGLAMLVPKKGKIAGLLLIVIAIPAVIPLLTVGLMFRLMALSGGVLPEILGSLGIGYSLTNPSHAFLTLVIVDAWHWTPLVFLIMVAGLRALPEEPFLAAKIDMASAWQKFKNITLPGLRFPLLFAVLLRFMDSFKIYDEPYILTGGGPGMSTEFLSLFVYRNAMGGFRMGYGAAASLVYLLIVLVACYLLMTVISKGKGVM